MSDARLEKHPAAEGSGRPQSIRGRVAIHVGRSRGADDADLVDTARHHLKPQPWQYMTAAQLIEEIGRMQNRAGCPTKSPAR